MTDVNDRGTGPFMLCCCCPGSPQEWLGNLGTGKQMSLTAYKSVRRGLRKRALQPENKPLNHLMLLITRKCKTPLIYHQTLLSRAHFHILAMTFNCSKEYSFAYQPLLHQTVQYRMQLYTLGLDLIACSISRSTLSTHE